MTRRPFLMICLLAILSLCWMKSAIVPFGRSEMEISSYDRKAQDIRFGYSPSSSFDEQVALPIGFMTDAFGSPVVNQAQISGGIVLIDEAHTPLSTIAGNPAYKEETRGKYSGFARTIREMGYTVSTLNPGETLTASKLENVGCLVIVSSIRPHTSSELSAISEWVLNGGRLLLISDWISVGNIERIANIFGASYGSLDFEDYLVDPTDYVGGQSYWIVFNHIESHPITQGLRQVEMYAVTNIRATGATILISTDDDTSWGSRGDRVPNTPVMVLIRHGSGEVVTIGDHNLWDDLDSDNDGIVDLNEKDNRRLLQNTIRYLYPGGSSGGQQESPRQIPAVQDVATATVIGAGASVGVVAVMSVTGVGAAVNTAISGLAIPDWLKDFLMFYGEETFKTLTPEQVETQKKRRRFLSGKQLMEVLFSSIMLFLVYSYVESNGFPNILDITNLVTVIPYVFLTVVFVFLFNVFFSILISAALSVWVETKVWLYGLISFLVTGILFLAPFASPSRTEYEGELDKRRAVSIAILKVVGTMILSVPFYFLYNMGYTVIGDVGLLVTCMSACFSSFPTKPLEGEEIFKYDKVVWFAVFASSFALYVSTVLKLVPLIFYLIWGLASILVSIVLIILARRAVTRQLPLPVVLPPPPPPEFS